MELMKVETPHHHEDDKIRVLFEASYKGCVSTLNSLIQKDPIILHKINSRSVFTETPLHISATLGHLEFTKALLTHKPQLALELDSFRSTALHLASAEGHIDVVKELLEAYDDACLATDQEGRIPLHYAVMRGRLEVVRELIGAKPESLRILDKGKTIFHLCVMYNQLEILKALVELELDIDTSELVNLGDLDGNNTILHLAILLKQVEMVRYLLSIPKIREAASLENDMGFTAHDILPRIPKDFKSFEIQVMLMNTGIKNERKGMDTPPQPPSSPSAATQVLEDAGRPPKENYLRKILLNIGNWLKHKGNWLEEMRGNLSLVSTVISTITFQAAINPPGGFIQQNIASAESALDCLNLTVKGYSACPGEALLSNNGDSKFFIFVIFNTISFMSSLGVTLLLVTGVPLKNKGIMWTLSIGMCITLTSLALAYVFAILMLSSDFPKAWNISLASLGTWIALLGLVAVYIVIRFVTWLVERYMKKIKHRMSRPRNRNRNDANLI